MTELEIRSSIIKAVQRLTSEGLVARTWGNVSARVDSEYFIITPSGKSYEGMTEDDLVKVRIDDLSYGEPAGGKAGGGKAGGGKAGGGKAAPLKPSSEKGIHADAYALRPEINFVIHTHQLYASAVSAAGRAIGSIPCAAYGLPGTKKLRKNVAACYSFAPKAILMERHGAVCLGENLEDAFASALKLEAECHRLFLDKVGEGFDLEREAASSSARLVKPYLDDYAQLMGWNGRTITDKDLQTGKIDADEMQAIEMVTAKNLAAAAFALKAGPMNYFDAALQHIVYKKKYSKLKNS